MNNLGVLYATGEGVAKDPEEAARLCRRAADAGNDLAARNLGTMYETGEGVPKDLKTALAWYQKGADLGDDESKKAVDRLKKTPGSGQ